jgi:hypothetical protein
MPAGKVRANFQPQSTTQKLAYSPQSSQKAAARFVEPVLELNRRSSPKRNEDVVCV